MPMSTMAALTGGGSCLNAGPAHSSKCMVCRRRVNGLPSCHAAKSIVTRGCAWDLQRTGPRVLRSPPQLLNSLHVRYTSNLLFPLQLGASAAVSMVVLSPPLTGPH